ncbi:Zinc knuckle CX2CX4HX4C [Corchorus olitorius]|uniref:Zinc knuckle CX2CX4HX4C n=1 Tax=Corchorus olitorius TaxID=93759 RepID=A0A1R3IKI9_9ROSI|nr:Zinc knuckle CX2CX4HX4C [Corchorus olitorius]
MEPPWFPRIEIQRGCSWEDIDSSSPESGGSAQDNTCIRNPPPSPELRNRRSHRIRFSTPQLEPARREGRECLVGFVVDIRKFSTRFIQDYINREWNLRGEAVVLGRDDNRYLIHFKNEVDRRVGILAFHCREDGRNSMEVLAVDYEQVAPRNVRFMRVRLRVNLNEPLTPVITLELDDGSTRWVCFRYERINKLCLSCGLIGHTHPNGTMPRTEVDNRINQRLISVSQKYGYPIVVDEHNPFFSNDMRAFLTRASRRTTRLAYLQRNEPEARNGANQIDRGGPELRATGNEGHTRQLENQQQEILNGDAQTNALTNGEPFDKSGEDNEEVQRETHPDEQREEPREVTPQHIEILQLAEDEEQMETDPRIGITAAPRMVQSSTPREVNVDSEGENLREQYERLEADQQEEPFLSREAQFHADLDAQLANLQVEMSVLTPSPILQPEPLQMRPPRMGQPL